MYHNGWKNDVEFAKKIKSAIEQCGWMDPSLAIDVTVRKPKKEGGCDGARGTPSREHERGAEARATKGGWGTPSEGRSKKAKHEQEESPIRMEWHEINAPSGAFLYKPRGDGKTAPVQFVSNASWHLKSEGITCLSAETLYNKYKSSWSSINWVYKGLGLGDGEALPTPYAALLPLNQFY